MVHKIRHSLRSSLNVGRLLVLYKQGDKGQKWAGLLRGQNVIIYLFKYFPAVLHCVWRIHTHIRAPNPSHNLDGKWCAMAGAELVQWSPTSGANIGHHSFLRLYLFCSLSVCPHQRPGGAREERAAILKNCSFNMKNLSFLQLQNYKWFMNVQK